MSKVNSLPLTITTDSNGDGSVTFRFHRDVLVHSVTAHKLASIDRKEFFRLLWYGRNPDATGQVSEGQQSQGGSGGAGGAGGLLRSSIIPKGSELYIAIAAGSDNASSNYSVYALFEVLP